MGVPTAEDGYISASTGKGDQEVHKGHNIHDFWFIVRVVRLLKKQNDVEKSKENSQP
jgi:hypothetical protein